MLAKKYRLPRSAFTAIKKNGKLFQGKNISFVILINEMENTRVGVIVSTKISKLATVRNLVKRKIMSDFFDKFASIANGYDILVLVRKSIIPLDASELSREVNTLLAKSGLMHESI